MSYFNVTLSGSVSVIIVSEDIEEQFVSMFKEAFLVPVLSALQVYRTRRNEQGEMESIIEYHIKLCKKDQDILWQACRASFTRHLQKSLPEISKS